MKSLKEQLVNESQSNKVWLLNNGMLIPSNDSFLKYDDEDYVNESKLLKSIKPGENFSKVLGNAINDFSGSLEVVWRGTVDEYVNLFNQ